MSVTRTPDYPVEERRRDLLAAWFEHRDERAREELVREYLGLVRALARRYAGGTEPLDDLVQVGSIGLVNALDRFDPDRGDFASFAVPTIVGELKRHFRDRTWTVSVPRSVKDLSVAVSKHLDHLSNELGRSPSIAELAQAVGADEEDVLEALEATRAQTVRPLVTGPDEEGEAADAGVLRVEEAGFAEVDDRSLLATGLRALDARERRIVTLRFAAHMTQSQIAREVGISQMHVSRLLRAALERMRASIESEGER